MFNKPIALYGEITKGGVTTSNANKIGSFRKKPKFPRHMIDMLLQTYASTEVQSLNDNWPQWQLYILYNRRSLAKRQASGKISGLHPAESPW